MKHPFLLTGAIASFTSLSLMGCNTAPNPLASGQGEFVNYQCKDGTTFTARIKDREAIADLPNHPNLALPYVTSETGAKYSDGIVTLEIHGPKAVVEIDGAIAYTECQALSAPITSPTAVAETTTAPTAAAPTPPQPSSTTTSLASETRTQRVQFATGATSAVVEDTIIGYESVDYLLGAQAGQYMNISMATNNSANYFNILAPGESEVALFNGSMNGNQYEGTLSASGDYTIRVYLMRSAARRDEVANYRLEMIISGGRERGYQGDAKVAGTAYHATGNLTCTMTPTAANGSCAYGVVREGNGSGFVEVTTQYGKTFSIYFQNGNAVGAEGGSGSFSSTRQGDTTYIYIGQERYTIPDGVIYGD